MPWDEDEAQPARKPAASDDFDKWLDMSDEDEYDRADEKKKRPAGKRERVTDDDDLFNV